MLVVLDFLIIFLNKKYKPKKLIIMDAIFVNNQQFFVDDQGHIMSFDFKD